MSEHTPGEIEQAARSGKRGFKVAHDLCNDGSCDVIKWACEQDAKIAALTQERDALARDLVYVDQMADQCLHYFETRQPKDWPDGRKRCLEWREHRAALAGPAPAEA